ncbi:DUF2306 domain-containing protein [Jannaschia sp. LMIT008]|uniref:DUF2306 domain-containing protein n=1 Tax=Jannaschia maritima TaxID=3032585 RepID=UPI0028120963|nr:DUF2306 domain-containing protein [Jannaschia sp. LMIT008]
MNPSALLTAPPPIPLHALAALLAIVLGAVQFALPKGTMRHRIMGHAWAVLLAGVAVSGLFIQQIRSFGPFSGIHLLSIFTLIMLAVAVRDARRGKVGAHKRGMIYLYGLALLLTGAFTLLPGRIMHEVLFG